MTQDIFTSYTQWLKQQKMPNGRRAVLLAGLSLFASQGYNGTSTAAIAKAANVSQATIFKYFKTKQDLLLTILKPTIENLFPIVRDDFIAELNQHKTLEAMIHFVVVDRYQFLKENSAAIQILLSELLTSPEIRAQFLTLAQASIPTFNSSNIQKLVATQQIRAGLTTLDVVRTIVGQLLTYYLQRTLVPDLPADEATDIQHIETSIVRALQPD